MHSDVLSAAVAGKSPSFEQALSVMVESRRDSSELLEAAGIIRKKFKGNICYIFQQGFHKYGKSLQRYMYLLYVQKRARFYCYIYGTYGKST